MKKDKRAVIDPSARCNYNPSSHSDAKKTTQITYFLNSPDAEQQATDRLDTHERVCCLLSGYALCVCAFMLAEVASLLDSVCKLCTHGVGC